MSRPSLGQIVPLAYPLTQPGQRVLRDGVNRLVSDLNGHLFAGIRASDIQAVRFQTANSDVVVPHILGRLPRGILVLNVDTDDAVVRAAASKWTTTTITLRCSKAGAEALLVVV